ncbi:SRPBCC family protein [Flavobacterium caeni]|uniref:Uncharacterized membrane protein n=1 Tax=Flavobacterium caeni TaxID=490189 RepID=A0A1G5CZC5_9FLAO|nr:SRPBCC family protein [Flavobacterium caeni]SCY07939.1 Uncharacterized membrane protein [Flavobacterium caeni]
MKTKQPTEKERLARKSHSKLDHSGTDPNRYGGYYSEEEARQLAGIKDRTATRSLIPGVDANIGFIERALMVAAGSYLLYNALSGKEKKVAQSIAAGGMLARGISGYCPVYDLTSDHGGKLKSSSINIRSSVVIDKPVDEVYAFWRKLENLPTFMNHLESVKPIDKITSEWKIKGPAGIGSLAWKAHILMDEPNKVLSWHSLPDAKISNSGKVSFVDLGDKTEVDLTLSYRAPMGVAGQQAAKWLNPWFDKMVARDFANLKSHLENNKNT